MRKHLLNYALPKQRVSLVYQLGRVACCGGVICGIAAVGAGIWCLWYSLYGSVAKSNSQYRHGLVIRGVAGFFVGVLFIGLCVKWLGDIRRHRTPGE